MSGISTLTNDKKTKALEYIEQFINGYRITQDLLPTVAGLAAHLYCSKKTIYNWTKKDSDFADTIERLEQMQEVALISNGLAGNYNPTIAKLILGKHGYSDRVDSNIGVVQGDVEAIKVEFIDVPRETIEDKSNKINKLPVELRSDDSKVEK